MTIGVARGRIDVLSNRLGVEKPKDRIMSFFSRLTDIVTCNVNELIRQSPDPRSAVQQILRELEEGVAGARRSAKTACSAEQRCTCEIQQNHSQIVYWNSQAKSDLASGNESAARISLMRKKEVEDLIAALQREQEAAKSTSDHLQTVLRAVEARLAEAKRIHREFFPESSVELHRSASQIEQSLLNPAEVDSQREQQIDEELARLKRELQTE